MRTIFHQIENNIKEVEIMVKEPYRTGLKQYSEINS